MKQVDWLERFVIILTGVFLYSFLTLLSDYVLPETITIITSVLVMTCLVEMYVPFNKWIRWTLEVFLFYLMLLAILGWRFIYPTTYTWTSVKQILWENFIQLQILAPFIVFVLGTWVIYLVMIRGFSSKWRALAIILICAFTLTIIDTFTSHNLWFDITLMISAVLLLLIVHHFKVLRKKSPEGWDHLKDYPTTVIAPIFIFFMVLLLSSIFIPENIRPLLVDPYTAWKQAQGEQPTITTHREDQDEIRPDTGPRPSGYGRDDRQLGNGFHYDTSSIMMIDTSHPTYYRGETRYFYNGQGWDEGDIGFHLDGHTVFPDDDQVSLTNPEREHIDQSLLQTREVIQTITFSVNANYAEHVLFGSSHIRAMEITEHFEREESESSIYDDQLENSAAPVLWLPNVSEVHYIGETGLFPKSYQVTSQVPLIDAEGLRDATAIDSEDAYWQRYLQLPDMLPERVFRLAEEITMDTSNNYDRVKAIESYLQETYPYTNTPDLSKGVSDDFVDRFLFEIQEGYCDYYSTAMVVLSRTLGIPTRWVKGFTQGTNTSDVENHYVFERDPLGPGVYNVRNSNAHSWVEVYFHGYGWIPFEPTATFSAPTYELIEETDGAPSVENDGLGDQGDYSWSWQTIVKIALIIIGAIGMGGTVLYLFLKQRDWLYWQIWKRHRAKSVNHNIIIEVEKLLNFGRRRGYDCFSNETLEETVTRWFHRNNLLERDFQVLLILFNKAKYGPELMSEKELSVTQEHIYNIKRALKGK